AVLRCIERNGPRGKERIAQVRALVAGGGDQLAVDSSLESDVARVIREAGMPRPVKRYRVIEADHFIAEVDLAWPAQKVAIQSHGSSFHRQPRTWENDQRVENRLQLHGWFVAKITRRMIDEERGQCLQLVAHAPTA